MGRLIVLTGERRVGKSTVCTELSALAREEGFRCAGIITLAASGEREVVDVRTGDRRPLTGDSEVGAVIQGRFRFSPETIQWASAVVGCATPCDLLVVDEIGPLEVVRGEGWADALDVVRRATYAMAVVVVRPELVETVCALLTPLQPEILYVTRENRCQLPGRLLRMLGKPS